MMNGENSSGGICGLIRSLQMHDVGDAIGVVGQDFSVFGEVNVGYGSLFTTWDCLDELFRF